MVNGRVELTGLVWRPLGWELAHAAFRTLVLVAAVMGFRRRRGIDDQWLLVVLGAELAVLHRVLPHHPAARAVQRDADGLRRLRPRTLHTAARKTIVTCAIGTRLDPTHACRHRRTDFTPPLIEGDRCLDRRRRLGGERHPHLPRRRRAVAAVPRRGPRHAGSVRHEPAAGVGVVRLAPRGDRRGAAERGARRARPLE